VENRKIKESWSKIQPDGATHERILNNILDRVHSGDTKKGKVYNMTMKPMRIFAPIAACIAVTLAVSIPMLLNNGGGYQPPDPIGNGGSYIASVPPTPVQTQTDKPNTPETNTTQAPIIIVNELPIMIDAARPAGLYPADFVPMNKNEVIDFYGFDFFPKSIPSDMMEVQDATYGIYKQNEGTGEVYYGVNLAWYVDENVSRELSVTIDVGRLPYTDAILLADGHEKSVINGIELVIQRSVDSAGEEMFVAEMMHEGNGLRVYSRNLTQTEFVDIVSSLLQDANVSN